MSEGSLVLYDLQSPINIGMLLRIAELFNREVYVVDSYHVFSCQKKTEVVRDFSVGAFFRQQLNFIDGIAELDGKLSGKRVIATTPHEKNVDVNTFDWLRGDQIILGNEYDGLPKMVCEIADFCVHISTSEPHMPKPVSISPIDNRRIKAVAREGYASLNVAMAGAIICHAAHCKLRG